MLPSVRAGDLTKDLAFGVWDIDFGNVQLIGGCGTSVSENTFDGSTRIVSCPRACDKVVETTFSYHLVPK